MNGTTRRPTDELGAWRWDRLAAVKKTNAYKQLAPVERQLVDHMTRRYDAMNDSGMFPSIKYTLAPKFKASERTIRRWLDHIIEAGIFIKESKPRRSGSGSKGGGNGKVFRLNPALFADSSEGANVRSLDRSPVRSLVRPEVLLGVHVEAAHIEAQAERSTLGSAANLATEGFSSSGTSALPGSEYVHRVTKREDQDEDQLASACASLADVLAATPPEKRAMVERSMAREREIMAPAGTTCGGCGAPIPGLDEGHCCPAEYERRKYIQCEK